MTDQTLDAQQEHDALLVDTQLDTRRAIAMATLKVVEPTTLVDRVAAEYGLTSERALELIEQFGG